MRDPERIERIINKLRAAWYATPDSRLCQLVVNVSLRNDPFFTEDDDFEASLDSFIESLKDRA